MGITLRPYKPADFGLVSDFLIAHYQPDNRDGNWLQPAWEYMHSHPNLDESLLHRIGLWEDGGELVGVAHYEDELGDAYFQIHPDYTHLRPAMLDYAETYLYGETESGRLALQVESKEFDQEFETLVASRGYQRSERYAGPMAAMAIPAQFPEIVLPEGFRIKSLSDENDLKKIHRGKRFSGTHGFFNSGKPLLGKVLF